MGEKYCSKENLEHTRNTTSVITDSQLFVHLRQLILILYNFISAYSINYSRRTVISMQLHKGEGQCVHVSMTTKIYLV